MHEIPKYLQLAQDLRASIESERIQVGALMPTETDLCAHYGVSRITVRTAMRVLSDQGLVSKRPGVGTRVERKAVRQQFVHTSDSVESVLQFTEETHFDLLDHAIVDSIDASLARPNYPVGQPRLRVRGIRRGVVKPLCATDLYMPVLHQSIVDALPNHKGSVILLMQRLFGVELKEIEQVIEATALSKAQATVLEARVGSPALVTRRWHRDSKGHTLIASISTYPADRYRYSVLLRQNTTPSSG